MVLELRLRDFSVWSTHLQEWAVVSGEFGVLVGSSSRDHRLHGQLQVSSATDA